MQFARPTLRRHLACFLAILAALCLPHRVLALDPGRAVTQYIQTLWDSETGLPQNSVHAIAQTRDGFLWFGTEEGLARFDGVQFTIYNRHTYKGLASDYIQALAADRDGSLWIGTDSGLTHYVSGGTQNGLDRPGRFVALGASDGLCGDIVTALQQSSDGALWVGTTKGLNRIEHGSIESWTASTGLAGDWVNSLVIDSSGAAWIGTDKGLSRYSSGRFTNWTRHEGLPGEQIVDLAERKDGSIWAAILGHGLVQLRGDRVHIEDLKTNLKEINAIREDRDGGLWIAFDRHGIGRLFHDKLSLYSASDGLPSNRLTRAIFEDKEGSVWFGMLDTGVVQLRAGKFSVFGKPEGLSGNYIGNLLQDRDGSMWLGTDSNGLNHLLPDGRVELWDHRRGLPEQAVYSILQTHDGDLWIGFRNGALARIHNGRVVPVAGFHGLDAPLNSLAEDRKGRIWLGTFGKGLWVLDHGRLQQLASSGRVPMILQLPDGAIWVAWDGDGIWRIQNGVTTRFTTANGMPSNHVMCLFAAANGDVWAGTASGGLSRIRGATIVSWTADQGLYDSTVGSIIGDDQGNLWFGGDSGIERVSMTELDRTSSGENRRVHPVLYGTADGLRSRETVYGSMPSTWKDRNGRLWFATIRGAAVIDPAHTSGNPVSPTAWIAEAQFDSQKIAPFDGMRLGHGSGNIEFSFSAPSFVAPQLETFKYRLVGFDKDWVEAGNRRSAWYTNLPPGSYTFRVIASNSDGKWNETGASLSFVLLPPISRSPTAYLLYFVVAVVLAWFVIRIRTRSLLQGQEKLKRLVAERTVQLESEKQALDTVRRELQQRATFDSLTGLFNRPTILERLEHELLRSVRDHSPVGVAIADLDHFKKINDSYGHLCGDEVIREAADRFRNALRSYDLAGRYGGEEFLIVLPGWSLEKAPRRFHDLLEAIHRLPFRTDRVELQVTCSIGVAMFRPGIDPPNVLSILKRADDALYAAKNAGRNCVTFDDQFKPDERPV